MNKKLNTFLFLIGGTLFNIIVTLGSIFLLLIVWVRLIAPHVPENVYSIGLIACFLGGAIIAFFVYRAVFGLITKKIDVEKYFDPLFRSRYQRKK